MKKSSVALLLKSSLVIATSCVLSGCMVPSWLDNTHTGLMSGHDQATASGLELSRRAFSRGNYGIAISHLELELAQNPASVAALNGLGASYDQLGRHDVAQRYFFRALELAPKSSLTLSNIGYSYILQGRGTEAVKFLELALQYDGNAAIAQENLLLAQALPTDEHENLPLVADFLNPNPVETFVQITPGPQPTSLVRTPLADPVFQTLPNSEVKVVAQAEPAASAQVQGLDATLRIEVSNGNGVNGMAARMRSFLQHNRGKVVRLTNADNYAYAQSMVYFRPGRRDAAVALVEHLSMKNVAVQESTDLAEWVDVRLLIGADLLAFIQNNFTADFTGASLAQTTVQ